MRISEPCNLSVPGKDSFLYTAADTLGQDISQVRALPGAPDLRLKRRKCTTRLIFAKIIKLLERDLAVALTICSLLQFPLEFHSQKGIPGRYR